MEHALRIGLALSGFVAGCFATKQFYVGAHRSAKKERHEAQLLLARSANILHETQKTIERTLDEIQAESEEEEEEGQ